MDWTNRNDRKWQAAYDAAARYYQAHGDLNVPSEYIDPDGVLLGKWVSRQRYAWQNPERSSARVTPERKALLDELGMVWEKPTRGSTATSWPWPTKRPPTAAWSSRHSTGRRKASGWAAGSAARSSCSRKGIRACAVSGSKP